MQATRNNKTGHTRAEARAHGAPERLAALRGYFRYHGVWAPGIRLFRAIGFKTKALLIALVVGLPLGVALTLLYTTRSK
jgi:hypothetical protein